MENPFVLPKEQYTRDLNLLKGYFEQNTLFLKVMTSRSEEECRDFLKRTLARTGKFPIKDPKMDVLMQESPGNRIRTELNLLDYIRTVTDTNRILSPSMVCYENPHVVKSPSALFVEAGIAGRKVAKNEMFKAKVAKDHVLEKIKDAEQNAKKIGINSLSGMHGFSGNILYVKSGHSSLTSMCRSATGYGNACNERLLAGSRHYWSPEVTIANLLALLTSQPEDEFDTTIREYGMIYPSVAETIECVRRSTSLYWSSKRQFSRIEDFISKLSGIQRAIIVYTGDLYHITKYNDAVVRNWMDSLIKYDPSNDQREYDGLDDPYALLTGKTFDGDITVLATYLNADLAKGESFDSLKQAGKIDTLVTIAKTAYNIQSVITKYKSFIRTFLTPKLLCPTVANIRGIQRRVVLASDTDSTIFTTQDWVKWYTGNYTRSKEGDGIWYTTTYISSQCIIHALAQLSTNMGVVKEELHRLSMKNEYAFPVFVLTNRAKHYYAFMSAREGNVYSEYDMEIKGVALRSSTVPPKVIKSAKKLMKEVMHRADEGRQFTLDELYRQVWGHEQDIYNSIKRGEHTYLKSGQIQASYSNMEKSNYRHYWMWQEVFAPKYGTVDTPPYGVIKVPLAIRNKTDMKNWLETIDTMDKEFADRLREYCVKNDRDQIRTLLLPIQILAGTGMPEEVMCMIDIRRLTYEILESFYMILESLGIFQVDSKYVRLISDIYTPEDADALPTAPFAEDDTLDEDDFITVLEDDDDEDWGME
jgi:hypothetical protein